MGEIPIYSAQMPGAFTGIFLSLTGLKGRLNFEKP